MQEVVAHWNEYPLPRQQNLFAAAVLHALEVGACCWWLLSVLMPGRSPIVRSAAAAGRRACHSSLCCPWLLHAIATARLLQPVAPSACTHLLQGRWDALEADLAVELDAGR